MNNPRHERERIAAAAARWTARRDAGLNEAERAEFEAWCAADPRHGAAVRHFATAWAALDCPPHAPAAGEIALELGRRQRRRRRATAAVAAVALLVGGFVFGRLPRTTEAGPTPSAHVTPGGVLMAPERRTLADGSVVELKPGAEIAVEFTPRLRRVVLLSGEAHFQVAHNAARPFAVDAGDIHVRAVGTAFAVQRQARHIEVLVTEGKIAIERPAAGAAEAAPVSSEAPATLVTATAGERVILARPEAAEPAEARVTAVSALELHERLAWREPRVEFSDTPLADAVALMNRASAANGGPRIVLAPAVAGLAREPISGLFRADNTEAFVRMLELSLPVKGERRGQEIVVRAGR